MLIFIFVELPSFKVNSCLKLLCCRMAVGRWMKFNMLKTCNRKMIPRIVRKLNEYVYKIGHEAYKIITSDEIVGTDDASEAFYINSFSCYIHSVSWVIFSKFLIFFLFFSIWFHSLENNKKTLDGNLAAAVEHFCN